MLEARRLFSYLTVYENLLMGAYTQADKKILEDIEDMYDLFPVIKARYKQTA